ncbi:hypothetical protein ACWDUN_21885 [Mycobacterium sp. NPDC003323]
MSQPISPARPAIVNIAFWLVLVGAVLLLLGGLMGLSSAVSGPTDRAAESLPADRAQDGRLLLGGMSALWAVSGMALSFLVGRARAGDLRFRRATVSLAVAVAVLVFLFVLLAPTLIAWPTVLGVVPMAIGATLFMRPAASDWFLEVQ